MPDAVFLLKPVKAELAYFHVLPLPLEFMEMMEAFSIWG